MQPQHINDIVQTTTEQKETENKTAAPSTGYVCDHPSDGPLPPTTMPNTALSDGALLSDSTALVQNDVPPAKMFTPAQVTETEDVVAQMLARWAIHQHNGTTGKASFLHEVAGPGRVVCVDQTKKTFYLFNETTGRFECHTGEACLVNLFKRTGSDLRTVIEKATLMLDRHNLHDITRTFNEDHDVQELARGYLYKAFKATLHDPEQVDMVDGVSLSKAIAAINACPLSWDGEDPDLAKFKDEQERTDYIEFRGEMERDDLLRCIESHRSDQDELAIRLLGMVSAKAREREHLREQKAEMQKNGVTTVFDKWEKIADECFEPTERKHWTSDVQAASSNEQWLSEADTNKDILSVSNGVIELRTGELRLGTPEDKLTMCTNTVYDPEADTAPWIEFICDLFLLKNPDGSWNEDKGGEAFYKYIQTMLGYSITGHTSAKQLPILTGSGDNAKSTLVNFLMLVMGEYGKVVAKEVLMSTGGGANAAGAASPHLAALKGVRIAIVDESERGHSLDTATVKLLTGGGDTMITARYLYGNYIEFPMHAQPFLSSNNQPEIKNVDDAIKGRVKMLPCDAKFCDRVPVPGKLAYDESNPCHRLKDEAKVERLRQNLPGFLTWLVQGAVQWYAEGLPEVPTRVAAATDTFIENVDVVLNVLPSLEFGLTTEYWCSRDELVRLWEQRTDSEVKPREIVAELKARGYPNVAYKPAERKVMTFGGRTETCRATKFTGFRIKKFKDEAVPEADVTPVQAVAVAAPIFGAAGKKRSCPSDDREDPHGKRPALNPAEDDAMDVEECF